MKFKIRFERYGNYTNSYYRYTNLKLFGIKLPITIGRPLIFHWSIDKLSDVLKKLDQFVYIKLIALDRNFPNTRDVAVGYESIMKYLDGHTIGEMALQWKLADTENGHILPDGSLAQEFNEPHDVIGMGIPLFVCMSRQDGGYIGDLDSTMVLVNMGITEFYMIRPYSDESEQSGKTCFTGFDPINQIWYGWARAMFGFKVGHTIQEGSLIDQPDGGWIKGCPQYDIAKERWADLKVGRVAETLEDCRRFAEAFADATA